MSAADEPQAPLVKPFAAILLRDPAALARGVAALEKILSPADLRGPARAFTATDYYAAEMGPGLSRCLVGFSRLELPGFLAGAKLAAAEAETALATGGKRTVNLDVGYLDLVKVVLASLKGRDNKFYLERGVWADLVLHYRDGGFQALPWTFPDFAAGVYDPELRELRTILRGQLREGTGGRDGEGP